MTEKITAPAELQKCIPPETSGMLEICFRLSCLEKEWTSLFSGAFEAIGRETAPCGCSFEDNSLILTVNVSSTSLLTSMKFKEKATREKVEQFLKLKVKKIEFTAGKVQRVSSAKEASRAYERYVPLKITEEQISKEKEIFSASGAGEELAETMARVKAMAEKKSKRQR